MQSRILTLVVSTLTLAAAAGVSAFEAVTLADYSGEEIFQRYCASCHGEAGRGDGPVARGLNTMVPDLTAISRRYGGFPAMLVRDVIDGRGMRIAHGTRTMPVWGYEFWVEGGGDAVAEREMKQVIKKLVDYVREIQDDSRAANGVDSGQRSTSSVDTVWLAPPLAYAAGLPIPK